MKSFEEDMLGIIENIQFKQVKCDFLSRLKKDVNTIHKSNSLIIPADKTNNYYKLDKGEYDKLLKDNVTAKYKQISNTDVTKINLKAKQISEQLHLADRIDSLAAKPAFITIKDHKEHFPNHIKCRLINPAKSEIGMISKKILDRINTDVAAATQVQQWKNTNEVIQWFNSINDKKSCTFLSFDVIDFYPSINETLLKEALEFASEFTAITEDEKEIIMHSKDTLLFHNNSTWQKSNQTNQFDITMGSYDGAETCELIGKYILHKIKHIIDHKDVGLYRDDGLAVLRNMSPSQTNQLVKSLTREFKNFGLNITTEICINVINFLDVTFNLKNNSYRPYSKPNNTAIYVNKKSNHSRNIIQMIPTSVNRRLSDISSDKDEFIASSQEYQNSLNEAGYDHKLIFEPRNEQRRNRNRKIIWYNPPFSKNVSTNVGRKFIHIIEKNFPKGSKLHKIFNKNNVKISYSCMDNMERIIDAHNKKILQKTTPAADNCNCKNPENCPLSGNCRTKNIVYKADVTSKRESNVYIGLCETEFKTRYNNHKSSFSLESKKNSTELSKYVWNLKEKDIDHKINWSILKHTKSYSNASKRCQLCLWEIFLYNNI